MEKDSKAELRTTFLETCRAISDLSQKLRARRRVSTDGLNSLSRLISACTRLLERGAKAGLFDDDDQAGGRPQSGDGPPIWNPNRRA